MKSILLREIRHYLTFVIFFDRAFCENKENKRFLSAPDFGKIVKCMFPNVKARRLGTRGNSK